MNDDLKRWDEEAEIWNTQIDSPTRIGKYILDDGFAKLVGNIQNKQILDAGCGNGRIAKVFTERGAKVIGVDGSSQMVIIAKRNYSEIEFRVGDLLQPLNFENNTFDLVVSANVLMSLVDINSFLSESFRILKSSGILVVSVLHPAFNSPTMKLYKPWWYKILGKPVAGLANDYFQKTTRRQDDHGTKPWPYYHRTLEEYFNSFRQHNYIVNKVIEPNTLPIEILQLQPKHYATRLPRFIFFKLIKQ